MTKYTQFVVGVILAGIFVGPTAASEATGARKLRVMQDTESKQTMVSLHQETESKVDLQKVKGVVDALFHWKDGVAGNVIVDHDDGSHCVIDAQPEKDMTTFSAGHKMVEFKYAEDGWRFHLMDDTELDSNGEMKKHHLSPTVLQAMMQAQTKGMLNADIDTLIDCTVDYFTIWEPDDDSRFFRSVFNGVRNAFNGAAQIVNNVFSRPLIGGCGLSDLASLALSVIGNIQRAGVPTATTCYSSGVAPLQNIFSGPLTGIPSAIMTGVQDLISNCEGFQNEIGATVSQIRGSCLFDEGRRLELDEFIESRRLSAN